MSETNFFFSDVGRFNATKAEVVDLADVLSIVLYSALLALFESKLRCMNLKYISQQNIDYK